MRALVDLLMPPNCPGCGMEDAVLCEACRAPLFRRRREPPGVPLGMPTSLPPGLLQLEWCAAYSGPVRAALHALKYRGERRLVEPLADALAERWQATGRGGDVLTWVPVHASRLRNRGFDQAELLARRTGALLGMPVVRCLERSRRTDAQHALGQTERMSNTGAAFVAAPAISRELVGRWPVVVDDIVTTGATLGGCAAALLDAGVVGVSALATARDR